MKRFFLIFTITISLFAKSFLISPIPLPKAQILDTELNECDNECLEKSLLDGKIFSFLAKAKNIQSKDLKEQFNLYASLFNLVEESQNFTKFRIALISPVKRIGKYAKSTMKSIIAYMLFKNANFYIKNFKIGDESTKTLQSTLNTIENENFDFVIAPLTSEGVKNIATISSNIKIYIPTFNKYTIDNSANSNIFFGGIDYKKQIDKLLNFANSKMAIFYEENSPLAIKLTSMIEKNSSFPIETIGINKEMTNFKRYFYNNEDLNESTLFLNTPIVESSLILSQLTLYDIEPKRVLSTQINYNPLIFTLTQYHDRKNLLVANSISNPSDLLEEINSIINNDIVFNWINYSTSIGIDYFFSNKVHSNRVFSEDIIDNQVVYKTILEKASIGSFEPIEEIQTEQETPYQ